MEKFLPLLKTCPLFAGIEKNDLQKLLHCLAAIESRVGKNSFIFTADERVISVGIVLSGAVHVLQEDFWGNRVILTRIEPGGLFGEAFAFAEVEKLPVSVVAAEESVVLLMDCKHIAAPCGSACAFHAQLIKNMMRILAGKNILLTQKIRHITRRTTREKLLSYLSGQALQAGGSAFDIPFSRQELADYLSVDRSALSAELSKMRNENILRCRRSHFELL